MSEKPSISDNAEWQQYSSVSTNRLDEINALVIRAFCYELSSRFEILLSIVQPIRTADAFSRVMDFKSGKIERER